MATARTHLKPRHRHEERACQSAWICSSVQHRVQPGNADAMPAAGLLPDGRALRPRPWFVATSGFVRVQRCFSGIAAQRPRPRWKLLEGA